MLSVGEFLFSPFVFSDLFSEVESLTRVAGRMSLLLLGGTEVCSGRCASIAAPHGTYSTETPFSKFRLLKYNFSIHSVAKSDVASRTNI